MKIHRGFAVHRHRNRGSWLRASCAALLVVAAIDVAAAGTITGQVRFDGPVPVAKSADRSSDPVCAKTNGAQPVLVTDGKLADAHVRITKGVTGKHKTPKAPALIRRDG